MTRYITRGTEVTGTVESALQRAQVLLQTDPGLAAEQAEEILKAVPNHPHAALLWGMALRRSGQIGRALAVLARLAAEQPQAGAAHYELGLACADAGQHENAAAALRRALVLKPDMIDAWRALADELTMLRDTAGADAAFAAMIKAGTSDPRLLAPAAALYENRIPEAETLLRTHLQRHPTDVAAIRMFAEVAGRLGRYQDAERLLERCLELAPSFDAARYNYAVVLNRQYKSAAAIDEIERLLATEPDNPGYRNLLAVILARIGDYREAIEVYAGILAAHPRQPKIWLSYGHTLASAGREGDSIAAYRRAIELADSSGEAYWSLANLKTFRFTAQDLAAIQTRLARRELADEERWHLHFAAGKALEDAAAYEQAFEHYAAGNRLRRASVTYDHRDTTAHVERSKALLTREFFAARAGHGAAEPDPIFIVGLPRAGSTLIEQILASHSAVEGTAELSDMISMARALGGRTRRHEATRYPEALAELDAAACRALGEQYLERTRIQRKTAKPFFIDKMPNNFLHVGLIQLALPRAKIIDARRHPLACCWSGYKQLFANGQNFTYDLEDLGRYYRDYVDLMAHFDVVLPGRIHRVRHESLIEDTEGEIRRLLEYCGLAFEPACLRFHATERAVRTASSQQVRKPIFRDGLKQWKHFDPWLEPLRRVLGPALGA